MYIVYMEDNPLYTSNVQHSCIYRRYYRYSFIYGRYLWIYFRYSCKQCRYQFIYCIYGGYFMYILPMFNIRVYTADINVHTTGIYIYRKYSCVRPISNCMYCIFIYLRYSLLYTTDVYVYSTDTHVYTADIHVYTGGSYVNSADMYTFTSDIHLPILTRKYSIAYIQWRIYERVEGGHRENKCVKDGISALFSVFDGFIHKIEA